MKYKYTFDEMTMKISGRKYRVIIVEDKIQLVSVFLMSDIQNDPNPNYVFEAIDEVLCGKREYAEFSGNVCLVKVYKDKSIIYDKLAEDAKGDWCEIETTELREFVEIWRDEVRRFYKKTLRMVI